MSELKGSGSVIVELDGLMTRRQVGEILSLGPRAIRELELGGKLPSVRINPRVVRIPRSAVARLIEESTS